jgi:hypothetical protein
LRTYLIAALAALTALAFAAVAYGQAGDTAELNLKVTPKKAGTKTNPKNSKIAVTVENGNTQRTMSKVTVVSPKTFKLSAKGLRKCAEATLEGGGPAACPRASRVGTGIAKALVGVNTPSPTPLTFDVTAVVTGSKKIGFFLAGRELPVNVMAPGTISGRNLTIKVPLNAQQPAPGLWAGLVSLEATMGAKKGKNYLASTTGCKRKKHRFKAVLTFVDNGVTAAGTLEAKGSSACS